MGDPQKIAPELCSKQWHLQLQEELRLRFIYRNSDCWHDFSDVDCVVAIRDFSKNRFHYKPAHKLYNAWLAGVPFTSGRDSAFASDGRPGYDYLIADSPEEVFLYLKRLKEDSAFRSRLVQNGYRWAAGFTREAILQCWKRLLQETIPVRALKWYQASVVKRNFLRFLQRISCRIQSVIYNYYKTKKNTCITGEQKDLFSWREKSDPFSWASSTKAP